MSSHQSFGSSGRSSMDAEQIEELDALTGSNTLGEPSILTVPSSQMNGRTMLPQTNTDGWIQMSLLNGLTITDDKENLNTPGVGQSTRWSGYKHGCLSSDSGLGHEESIEIGVCRSGILRNGKNRNRNASYSEDLLPKPPNYWMIAVFIAVLNPLFGVTAMVMCYLTDRDVKKGHLLHAKKRSKGTLLVIVTGFGISVLTIVVLIIVFTAQNKFPFLRKTSEVTATTKPPPLRDVPVGTDSGRPRVKPPPPPPPPPFGAKPETKSDFFTRMEEYWRGRNASSVISRLREGGDSPYNTAEDGSDPNVSNVNRTLSSMETMDDSGNNNTVTSSTLANPRGEPLQTDGLRRDPDN